MAKWSKANLKKNLGEEKKGEKDQIKKKRIKNKERTDEKRKKKEKLYSCRWIDRNKLRKFFSLIVLN